MEQIKPENHAVASALRHPSPSDLNVNFLLTTNFLPNLLSFTDAQKCKLFKLYTYHKMITAKILPRSK